ncbi:MAG: S-methyl-5-thioribose-1-phosphate isomerase [Nitrospirales bacterium]|nr:S-methyl-5-thioribose-1-phosphate isomerase [Nitrospirales bacterium]
MIPTVEWKDGVVRLLDQSRLPNSVEILECRDYQTVARAIRELKVRGAPAIGVTAALGVALGAQAVQGPTMELFTKAVFGICQELAATRPTAVNLFWAIDRMKRVLSACQENPVALVKQRLLEEAQTILEEDIAINRAIGTHGARLLQDGQRILTHCNAGALATAGYGTALGVVRAAWEQGKQIHVFADETRPVLQGARLTAWELKQDGIPVTVMTDNMAGALMRQEGIDVCIVGADRIAANGDVANKIGTYAVAVLAHVHGLPFYVAAPSSTVDLNTPTGDAIPIEQRDEQEVRTINGGPAVIPDGVAVWNPAFDVTPAKYVTAIITEKGIVRPGYEELQSII